MPFDKSPISPLPRLGAALCGAVVIVAEACNTAPQSERVPLNVGNRSGAGVTFNVARLIGNPRRLTIAGQYLVILNQLPNPAVTVLDKTTGVHIASFGRRGTGPGEFEVPWQVAAAPRSSDAVSVFDLQTKRVTLLGVGDPAAMGALRRTVSLGFAGAVLCPVWIDSNTVLTTGVFERRFKLLDLMRRGAREVGEPLPVPAELALDVKATAAAQGALGIRPDRSRLVFAGRFLGQLLFYDRDGSFVGSATTTHASEPIFDSVSNRRPFIQGAGMQHIQYLDVAATEERILALYSGDRDAPGLSHLGHVVEVYDWSGHLVGTFPLSTPTDAIAVDPTSDNVFAAQWQSDSTQDDDWVIKVYHVAAAFTSSATRLGNR
jgi:hypothetical protein